MVDRFPKIDARLLKLGMFVADLDRPWLDTPFIMEGLLLEHESDLAILRRLCQYVYIDPLRSTIDLRLVGNGIERSDRRNPSSTSLATRDASRTAAAPHSGSGDSLIETQATVTEADAQARHATSSVDSGRAWPRGQSAIHGNWKLGPEHGDLAATARALISDSGSRARVSRESARKLVDALADASPWRRGREKDQPAAVDPALIPPSVEVLTAYRVEHPIHAEMPRARETFARTEAALEQILIDLEVSATVQVDLVEKTSDDLVDSIVANPDAMMWVARLRGEDAKTYAHGLRVAVYLLTLGRHLGFPRAELRTLGMIGLLIDVGKLRVPRELLDKRSKLTEGEFAEIKRHVDYGLELLDRTRGVTTEVLQGIAEHHERLNGQGYPHGLRDQQISVYGRMAGLADCFAALVTPRPYAEAMAPSDSLLRLFEWSGEYFHPALVERFVQAIGVFPVGSLVELSTGHVGIVVRHNRLRRLQPVLLLLTDSHKRPRQQPKEINLMKSKTRDEGRPVRIVRGLPTGAYGLDTDGGVAARAEEAQMES